MGIPGGNHLVNLSKSSKSIFEFIFVPVTIAPPPCLRQGGGGGCKKFKGGGAVKNPDGGLNVTEE